MKQFFLNVLSGILSGVLIKLIFYLLTRIN
jgi:hypothetical protein